MSSTWRMKSINMKNSDALRPKQATRSVGFDVRYNFYVRAIAVIMQWSCYVDYTPVQATGNLTLSERWKRLPNLDSGLVKPFIVATHSQMSIISLEVYLKYKN